MSARDKDAPNLRIPIRSNHPTAAPSDTSLFQNNNMSLSKNNQINNSPNVPHYNQIKNTNSSNTTSSSQNITTFTSKHQHDRARNIMSLRQPHQPIDPTPLRQQMTNSSLRHTSEPIMSTAASSFTQNNKTASSSSQNPKSTSTSNTTTQDPKDQAPNNTDDPNCTLTTANSKGHNDNTKAKSVIKNYTLGPRKYTFPTRRSDATWIDPRYDLNLTLAERLEAATDLPLAAISEYEWKMENEYVGLTSWQPPHRRGREWKGMGE
jgi:hypothetical protein